MSVELVSAALLTGSLWFLLAGNIIEWHSGAVARLSEPCVDPRKPLASIVYVSVAGAYLFVNEVLAVREENKIGWPFTLSALVFAGLWCLAGGILSLEFLWQMAQFFQGANTGNTQ